MTADLQSDNIANPQPSIKVNAVSPIASREG